MRLAYMGTPDFAVPSLEALVAAGHEVKVVFTQPDRARGRGQKLTPSPVKEAAQRLGLPVLQPEKVSHPQSIAALRELDLEAIIVVAFGQKIPSEILKMTPYGCINLHGSLLPKYRGAAPIHRAVIEGERETGVTTMLMDEGWDTGDILQMASVEIGPKETVGHLHDRLAQIGASLLVETLRELAQGSLHPRPQPGGETYAKKLTDADQWLNWSDPADSLFNQIRGMNPWPGAKTTHAQRVLTIEEAQVEAGEGEIGQVLDLGDQGFAVGTGHGRLRILRLRPAGKQSMTGRDYQNGYGVCVGDGLGEGAWT